MIKRGNLKFPANNCIIGFDAEWTKNYKIKNGNIPFCFSAVSVREKDFSIEKLLSGSILFEYIQYYCEDNNELKKLISKANYILSEIMNNLNNCILCGHQLSSDFNVFLNIARAYNFNEADSIARIISLWRERKTKTEIFDTRYDISRSFLGKSRRLVDMCIDFNLDVRQPELGNSSMTKLQNHYYDINETTIRERLSVMNLRHSFSATVLTWLNKQLTDTPHNKQININKTISNRTWGRFWVDSLA